jgi:hypothetical protein
LESKPEPESESEETVTSIDLDSVLRTLRDNDVHSFQGMGITVVFNEKEVYVPKKSTEAKSEPVEDDGHSTSNRRVSGFRDPALWRHQNGKALTFRGTLE